jgi:hypothetical protein
MFHLNSISKKAVLSFHYIQILLTQKLLSECLSVNATLHSTIGAESTYSLLLRDLFILGSQNIVFLAAWAEIKKQTKRKQSTVHRGDIMSHRFL